MPFRSYKKNEYFAGIFTFWLYPRRVFFPQEVVIFIPLFFFSPTLWTHALSGCSHDGTLLFCFGLQLGDRCRGLLLQLVHVHVLQVLNLTQEGVFAFLLCSVLIHHLEQLLGHVHVIPGHLDHVLILLALHVTTSEHRARSESRNINALRWKLIYKTSWIMITAFLHFMLNSYKENWTGFLKIYV